MCTAENCVSVMGGNSAVGNKRNVVVDTYFFTNFRRGHCFEGATVANSYYSVYISVKRLLVNSLDWTTRAL